VGVLQPTLKQLQVRGLAANVVAIAQKTAKEERV